MQTVFRGFGHLRSSEAQDK